MRAVNARLGYQPLPDELTMRGPLVGRAGASAGDGHHDRRDRPATDPPLPRPTRPPTTRRATSAPGPRASRARYITGGGDPNLAAAQAEDRRYGRLLIWMVVAIVAAGFIIGILLALAGRGPLTVTEVAALPSASIPAATWAAAHDAPRRRRSRTSSGSRRSIRRRRPGADGETRVARYLEARLRDLGLEPEVVEPVPGRGYVHVRLRGDGTGGDPFLLLSHLDVVAAPPERWTHDPFAATSPTATSSAAARST